MLRYVRSLQCADAPIKVLIEHSAAFHMLQSLAFKVGAYISREQRPILAKAIRVVNDGEPWMSRRPVAKDWIIFQQNLPMWQLLI